MQPILTLKKLKKHYPVQKGALRRQVSAVRALDEVDLEIVRGECLGLVGESGCGKTTTGKVLVRLHRPSAGQIWFHPQAGSAPVELAGLSPRQLKRTGLRRKLQMVFQDPTASLNPRMLVKHIIAEPLRQQGRMRSRILVDRVVQTLEMVGLGANHLLRYPHEFSGGQRQRIAVARAVASQPEFIVLDEPTSALDVSVQAQILNLLRGLQQELGLTYLFVTHHLLVVKYISQRIAVMYLGKVVEVASTAQLFERPLHPYTHALLSGIPVPEVGRRGDRMVLTGDVPSPMDPPSGCRFHTRCPFCIDHCRRAEPMLENIDSGHRVACHRSAEVPSLVSGFNAG